MPSSNGLYIKEYHTGYGRTKVLAVCVSCDRGINISIFGGQSLHVGAVVMALPRQSLTGNGTISSDCFVIPVPGHKDYIVANKVAHEVATRTNLTTAVSAGIHSDDIASEEISLILNNIDCIIAEMIQDIVIFLKKEW